MAENEMSSEEKIQTAEAFCVMIQKQQNILSESQELSDKLKAAGTIGEIALQYHLLSLSPEEVSELGKNGIIHLPAHGLGPCHFNMPVPFQKGQPHSLEVF